MNQVQMAAKLYECRDTAKKFYGKDFKSKLEPYTKIVKDVMQARHLDVIPALLLISKSETYNSSGMVQMMFMAATVELIEPSNDPPKYTSSDFVKDVRAWELTLRIVCQADMI